MLAVIEQDLFAHDPGLPLLELVALGRQGRHALILDPPFDPLTHGAATVWLNSLGPLVQSQIERILQRGTVDSTALPADVSTVRVTGGTPDWQRGRMSVDQALVLLRTPLRLLLENRRADFGFFRRLVPQTRRRELDEAVAKGWVQVLHGGGLGEMVAMVQEMASAPSCDRRASTDRLRTWLMFDRDSAPEDRREPSPQSEGLRRLCQEAGSLDPWALSHHQLGRRSIENYLPMSALRRWVERGKGKRKTNRRHTLEAYKALREHSPLAGWQHNMKRGLSGDASDDVRRLAKNEGRGPGDEDLDPLFRGLSDTHREALAEGFGRSIAELFLGGAGPDENAFEKEYRRGPKAQPTRESLVDSLFARM